MHFTGGYFKMEHSYGIVVPQNWNVFDVCDEDFNHNFFTRVHTKFV